MIEVIQKISSDWLQSLQQDMRANYKYRPSDATSEFNGSYFTDEYYFPCLFDCS